MKTSYAYLGKSGILHISRNYDTAKTYSANNIIIETTVENEHGYPVSGGESIIVYSPEKMKITAKGDDIEPIKALGELYNKCK